MLKRLNKYRRWILFGVLAIFLLIGLIYSVIRSDFNFWNIKPEIWITWLVGGGWAYLKQIQAKQADTKIESLKQELTNKGHYSQAMFDTELDVYKKLSEKLVKAYDDSSWLQPQMDSLPEDEAEQLKIMHQRDRNFSDSFNALSIVRREYAPFYSDKIGKELEDICHKMQEIHNLFTFKYFNNDIMKKYAGSVKMISRNIELHKQVDEQYEVIISEIRKRLIIISQ